MTTPVTREDAKDERRSGGSLPVVIAVLALALLVTGLVWRGEEEPPAASGTGDGLVLPDARSADTLEIPTIRLAAPIDAIEIDPAGVLTPPSDVKRVGWWQRSADPGAGEGQTVITGHTVHTGGGVMNRVKELERGDEVYVHDDGVVHAYEVTAIQTLSKQQVSRRAPALFGQDRPDGRLVLVTCEDWVDGEYQSNIVVFARPLGSSSDEDVAA